MKLKEDSKLKSVVPELRAADLEILRNSIKLKGLLKPIDVMSDGTIVDGYHRHLICLELNIEPIYTVMPNIKTVDEALAYSFEVNFARRRLSEYSKAEWAYQVIDPIETALAKKRQTGTLAPSMGELHRVVDTVGNRIGIGGDLYERAKRIIKIEGYEQIKKLLRIGDLTIGEAYDKIFNVKESHEDEDLKLKVRFFNVTDFENGTTHKCPHCKQLFMEKEEENQGINAAAERFFQKSDGTYKGKAFVGLVNINKIKKSDLFSEKV